SERLEPFLARNFGKTFSDEKPPFTGLLLERFGRKEDASADKQRAGTAPLKESRTVGQAGSSAVFDRSHRPSSHSPVRCSSDKRAVGPRVRQLSARETPVDRNRGYARSREVSTAGRCETTIGCG